MNEGRDGRTNHQEHGSWARVDASHKSGQTEQKPTYRSDKHRHHGDKRHHAPDASHPWGWYIEGWYIEDLDAEDAHQQHRPDQSHHEANHSQHPYSFLLASMESYQPTQRQYQGKNK